MANLCSQNSPNQSLAISLNQGMDIRPLCPVNSDRLESMLCYKPIIIRDAGGAPRASPWHHLVSPIRFANGAT